MTTSVGSARWRAAQAGQERAQRNKRARMRGGEAGVVASVLRVSAGMEARLAKSGGPTSGVVVEVGSGAHGLIWGWPAGTRVAIDPLATFFATEFAFLQRGTGVAILEARGEELPLATRSVDLVLSDNVLDHLEDPAALLAEIERVLVPGGFVFLSADTHHRVWSAGAKAYNAFGALTRRYPRVPAFPNHPFHFTPRELDELLAATSLVVREREALFAPGFGAFNRQRPYDVLKGVFYKNRRVELLLQKPA